MKKQYLLQKNKEYRKIYQQGFSLANRFVVVFCLPNNFTYRRFGFSIGKKIGKAVQRNKVKRRLKAVCRENKQWFKDGYDYILIARKGINNQPFLKVQESVENLTYRINKKLTREING